MRLYYGVDFKDESFYVAVPYRLVHGADVFVTETAVAQSFVGLLVYPFVRAYDHLVGQTGIVLFVRHLHLLFSLAVAAAVTLSLRSVLATRRAALVGLLTVAYVPFNIHSLSYNTLGSGFLTAGCLFSFWCLREPERRVLCVLEGLCLGLAVFAYQPLIVPVAVCYGIRVALTQAAARRALLVYSVPALTLPLAASASLVASVGLSEFRANVRARGSTVGRDTGDKLRQFAEHEVDWLWQPTLLVLAVVVLVLVWRRRRDVAGAIVLALPVLVLPPGPISAFSSLEYVAHFAWLGLPLFPIVRRHPGAAQLLGVALLPGIAGAVTTGLSSSNGPMNAGVGALPAMLASSAFLLWALQELLPHRLVRLAAVPVVSTLAILLVFETVPSYNDKSIESLRVQVDGSAFAGLHTTTDQRDVVRRLRRDLASVDESCRIVFLDLPAGYLLTKAQAHTTSAWREPHEQLLAYYRQHGPPDVAVIADAQLNAPDDPLLDTLRGPPYRLVASHAFYEIYRRENPTCASR